MTDHDLRQAAGYTPEQAQCLPGWHKARHKAESGEWFDCMELRDETGQVQRRISLEEWLQNKT